jgi:hypothetical protein
MPFRELWLTRDPSDRASLVQGPTRDLTDRESPGHRMQRGILDSPRVGHAEGWV